MPSHAIYAKHARTIFDAFPGERVEHSLKARHSRERRPLHNSDVSPRRGELLPVIPRENGHRRTIVS